MKRLLLSITLLAVAGGVSFGQGISGTGHDLRTFIGGAQLCVPCHTPHNASPAVPLWNHTTSGSTYTAYTSPTIDAVDLADGPWTGTITALCLSCHDDVVALGSVVNDPGDFTDTTNTMSFFNAGAALGIDMSNDHPVAFTYDTILSGADPDIKDPATTGRQLFGPGGDQMECATCHNAHDNSVAPFLVTSNSGSALCLSCHSK